MPDASQPCVSAIIPVYNGERRVGRAIESALGQTYPPADVIVIDDGSTDGTLSVAREYPVTVISQANSGPGAARNAGAAIATGQWLAFLDHDDAWMPEKTARQLEYASDGSAGVIYTPRCKKEDVPITWDRLWAANVVGSPTGAIVRRECFFDAGGFDPRRILIGTEDYNLWLKIALTDWRFVKCP
ncbi:MAG: glycosyltransferase family 2 protein, partial [Bryobacteraceae bacterium]